MLDFNTYQASLYKKLKEIELDEATELAVYDKVPANAKFPFAIISNYDFEEGDLKDGSYLINQNLEIWSDYQGKKSPPTLPR